MTVTRVGNNRGVCNRGVRRVIIRGVCDFVRVFVSPHAKNKNS